MVPKVFVALALVLLHVDGFPTDQQVLPPIEASSGIEANGLENVREELKKAEIIPTVIDDFLPLLSLDVKWSKRNQASLGNTLKPKRLQDEPTVALKLPEASTTVCGSETQLVITLSDPDVPSRDDPKRSEMCHWIASGVAVSTGLDRETGKCSAVTLRSKLGELMMLDEIMPYKPPAPPEKTGKHRYVFLAFAPANGTTDDLHLSKPSFREHWGYAGEERGVRDWARDNGLVPIAANFIYAQYET